MKLVRFELKKLFRSAGFRYLCAALLVLTFLFALFTSPYLPEDEDYIAKYEDNISYVIRVAKRNLLEYEAVSDGDHYMMRYQRDVIERYSSLLNDGVKPTEIRGWNEFFNNNVDELLALIGAILAGVLLSLAEFDNGTEKILHITRNGRKSVLSKISVLALFSFAEIILMTAASLVGTTLHFGLSSPSAYLCSVEIFTYCPYGFTIGRYIVLSVLIKAAALFLISVLAALAAVLTRSYLASIVLPSALICGGYMISKGGNANLPDIYSIVLTSPIFVRYRSLNVFDKSIPVAVSSVFMLTLLGAASAVLLYFLFLKVIGGSRISDLERSIVKLIVKAKDYILSIFPKKKARRRGLLFSEAKKSFIKSHLIFLCAVMIIIKIGLSAETMKNNNPAEEFYRDICYSMSGELTDEKRALVSDKLAECNAVISRFNSMRDAVVSGMITNDEYQTYLDEHSRASAERYGITPIFGMEIRFKGVSNDYLLYGITSDDLPRLCELVEGSVEAFSEVFRRRGVLFFQAHPKRDGMVEIDPRYLDGVESFNTHLGHNSRIGQAAAFANASGLIAIGGSDFHHEGHQGTCLLRTKERIDSEQTLVRVLSSRDYLLDIGGSIVLP